MLSGYPKRSVIVKTIEWLKPRYPEICEHVKIQTAVDFRTIPGFTKLVKQFEKHVTPKIKTSRCYDNSLHAMKFFVKKGFAVEYIEGFANMGILHCEHAWNAVTIDGVRYIFDVTASELFVSHEKPCGNDYAELYSCSDLAVLKWYFKHQIPTATFRKINWIHQNQDTPFQMVVP